MWGPKTKHNSTDEKKNFKHEEMFMCNYEKFRWPEFVTIRGQLSAEQVKKSASSLHFYLKPVAPLTQSAAHLHNLRSL